MPDQPPIPEIIVPGRRPEPLPPDFYAPNIPAGPGFSRYGGYSGQNIRYWQSFVPPVLATPIEEIVVTASRSSQIPAATSSAGWGSLRLLGWIGAAIGGIAWLDHYARQVQREEDETRDKIRRDREIAQMAEQMSSQVTVVGFAPPEKSPYVLPPLPLPLIEPGADPFRMIPIMPPMPQKEFAPAPVPGVEIAPVESPQVPRPYRPARRPGLLPELLPLRTPGPMFVPRIVPSTTPGTSPAPSISPSTAPSPAPAGSPLTWISPQLSPAPSTSSSPQVSSFGMSSPSTIGRTTTQTQRLTQTEPMELSLPDLQAGTTNCPPCEKDPPEPRQECWKKLVKEHMYPEFDESYDWVRIDCLTGREL